MDDQILPNIGYPIRVIIPIVYFFITIIAVIGNIINFYSLCVNGDRYGRKSLHLLIWNVTVSDGIWVGIFFVVKMVSYANLSAGWLNNSWCKAEYYILRSMDFLLAYTIVFMCIDRCVRRKTCWYGIRRFKSGLCIVLALWLAVCYALIPILFFNQELKDLNYGAYECQTNATTLNQLTWLNLQSIQTPTQTIYILDFMFGNGLPVFLMIVFLFLRLICHRKRSSANMDMDAYKQLNFSLYDDEHPNLSKMVVFYVLIYILCQLPYYIYRLVRIYQPYIDENLKNINIFYAIDIPLIALRLINRAINPWLAFFFMRQLRDSSRHFCSFWCFGFIPGCPNRWSCLKDCTSCVKDEWHDLTANNQMVREIRPTGNTMKKEYLDENGKRVRQTYEEYVRHYHRPKTHFSDANPALLLGGKSVPENFGYTNQAYSTTKTYVPHANEPRTEL
ncbi:unnamed protein product [Didymodactylos carnosus]|uniref:G-protein coupled receptors family 1 profile domain-containing protein n=1 Tax=Didymodactylos carnosus TaxID=1234261 RepID=A0A814K5S5_9BILA|nr:unnamed protein product [Didymodactylos carnosus]CAF1047290.1 unnamed protein product [Didymodactylos carnosus]CAF3759981.1 unnamed protein product [Didymodactylos carnosus]CAF3817041.1 unnamed protein product [Didymodactylos carnosus]